MQEIIAKTLRQAKVRRHSDALLVNPEPHQFDAVHTALLCLTTPLLPYHPSILNFSPYL